MGASKTFKEVESGMNEDVVELTVIRRDFSEYKETFLIANEDIARRKRDELLCSRDVVRVRLVRVTFTRKEEEI